MGPLAYAQQSDVILELRPSQTNLANEDTFYVDVYVTNPSGQTISSVRSWLSYPPRDLEVVSIERLDSPFDLPAPGENEASSDEELIKLGYSNLEGVTAGEVLLARVNFKVDTKQKKNVGLEFYNYQSTELGHTSVTLNENGFPVNILAQKPELLSFTLNGGPPTANAEQPVKIKPAEQPSNSPSTEEKVVTQTPAEQKSAIEPTPISTGPLSAPVNLKLDTTQNKVQLRWSAANDSRVIGYYLYYGKTPGLYTRRKTLNSLDSFELEGLQNGETYYFGVTAYDLAKNESDYSNEAAVIVGQSLSATHPLTSFVAPTSKNNTILAQVPASPENGPALNWFLISTLGLGVVLGLGRRRKT